MKAEVDDHHDEVERILSSLSALASHDRIVEAAPIVEYRDRLK